MGGKLQRGIPCGHASQTWDGVISFKAKMRSTFGNGFPRKSFSTAARASWLDRIEGKRYWRTFGDKHGSEIFIQDENRPEGYNRAFQLLEINLRDGAYKGVKILFRFMLVTAAP
jgi:hypothetical protein